MMLNAMKQGWKLWTTHFADSLAYILIVTAIMLVPVAPLLALVSKSVAVQAVAVLCVPLFVLLVLPLRRSAALVLRRVVLGDTCMNDARLISFDRYGKKLLHGLEVTLLLLAWALPGLAATGYAMYMYKTASSITVMMSISRLGGGDIVRGVEYLLLIYAACWLPLMVGLMLHSGARHAWAMGRKLPKGKRGTLCLVWLVSLVIAVPFLVGAALVLKNQLSPAMKLLKTFQLDAAFACLKPLAWQLPACFAVLLLPLVPLRHLMIAACIHGDDVHQA